MNTTNIITARFGTCNQAVTAERYQYDYGQVLQFSGIPLPAAYVVDFSNNPKGGDSTSQIGGEDGVNIPDVYFLIGRPVYAFVYLHTGEDDGETVYRVEIPVRPRPARTNATPTPVQQSVIDETIAALNAGVEAAEDARDAIADMSVSASGLPAGSDPTVAKTVNPTTGAISLAFGIPKGDQGDTGETGPAGQDGAPGQDGYSPTVAVTDITDGHRVTITDAEGDHSFDVMDGADGTNGQDGAPGANGTTFTPTVSDQGVISWSNDGGKQNPASVNIKGPQGETGPAGQDGQDGAPGVGVPSGGADGQMLVKDGATDYATKWANQPTIPVSDVQINGTSIVSNGVANIPKASTANPGVVKYSNSNGVVVGTGNNLTLAKANDAQTKAGTSAELAVRIEKQHASTFYGLAKAAGDSTQSASENAVGTYTENAKSAISEMLNGSVSVSGSTPTIAAKPGVRYVCGEVATLTITVPATGIIDVVFESGSTATVLTVTPPTGVTAIKWANGFDPTTLDANTVYEINIMDGEYGVVGIWT